jgi:hypothetical protein
MSNGMHDRNWELYLCVVWRRLPVKIAAPHQSTCQWTTGQCRRAADPFSSSSIDDDQGATESVVGTLGLLSRRSKGIDQDGGLHGALEDNGWIDGAGERRRWLRGTGRGRKQTCWILPRSFFVFFSLARSYSKYINIVDIKSASLESFLIGI